MSRKYSPGSFTKNFSWDESYTRLHGSIARGFNGQDEPVAREKWRSRSGIKDADRQLIPLNFFLYSVPGITEDYVLVDQLVDTSVDPYGDQFAQLALFAFHLAESGAWRATKWSDGHVAGWAHEFICNHAWHKNDWSASEFKNRSLMDFIDRKLDAEPVTKRKVFTNYRYMLRSAGALDGDVLKGRDLRQRWFVDAVQLFWDRQILKGALPATASSATLEDALIANEIYKLLRCDEDQCIAFARAAYVEFSQGQASHRSNQIETLKGKGLIAA